MAEPENSPSVEEPQPDGADLETSPDAPTLESDADADALEHSDDPGDDDGTVDATGGNAPTPAPAPKGVRHVFRRFNIYLLFFVFVLVVAGVIIGIAYFQSKKAATTSTLKTQQLTQDALHQVADSDATVGNSQQILNVQSSAVFAGKVLIRDGLEVAGSLQIGGTVGLTNLTVSGTTQLGQAQVNKDLAVAGDTGIQGSASIAKSLQVSGNGTFGGNISAPQITTSNLQLNADLVLTHHISAGGATPGRSGGPALGGGGSASVSGSDTAGTVSINTGGSPAAGCFVTVNFTSKYNATPHVLLTPVGSGGGGLSYYVNRTTTSFSICVATAPPASASFGFDYFVLD